MTEPYATIAQALAVVEREACALPPVTSPHVCPYCFGPKGLAYNQCHGCLCLLRTGADPALLRRVLPITIALAPGDWYSRMASYKGASPENSYLLAAALYAAVDAWQDQLRHALNGSVDAICITPSTRGVPLRQQRLAGAVQLIKQFLPPLEPLLEATPGRAKPRNRVDAELFHGEEQRIAGKRILLIEDTWVSGAAAVSAAVTLRNARAEDVLIVALARRVEIEGAQKLHGTGYQDAMGDARWRADPLPWPR